jgi:hypothetical protein
LQVIISIRQREAVETAPIQNPSVISDGNRFEELLLKALPPAGHALATLPPLVFELRPGHHGARIAVKIISESIHDAGNSIIGI